VNLEVYLKVQSLARLRKITNALDSNNATEMQTVYHLNISIVFCCHTSLHAIFSFSAFHIVHYSLNMCILFSCFRFLNI